MNCKKPVIVGRQFTERIRHGFHIPFFPAFPGIHTDQYKQFISLIHQVSFCSLFQCTSLCLHSHSNVIAPLTFDVGVLNSQDKAFLSPILQILFGFYAVCRGIHTGKLGGFPSLDHREIQFTVGNLNMGN